MSKNSLANSQKMTNTCYIQINLNDILKGIGEDGTKKILSSFSCSLNKDVESFLKDKAIEFSKRGFAKTHLVYWQSADNLEKELIGYYSLATKSFTLSKDSVSNSTYKKISHFGTFEPNIGKCVVPAILIGQLGKNYTGGNDCLISGDELLKLALERVANIQNDVGGKYTYLECEDVPFLNKFYTDNGFISFGKRSLDRDETDISGSYLVQYLKRI